MRVDSLPTWPQRRYLGDGAGVVLGAGPLWPGWPLADILADFAPEGSSGQQRIASYVEEEGVGGVILSVGWLF